MVKKVILSEMGCYSHKHYWFLVPRTLAQAVCSKLTSVMSFARKKIAKVMILGANIHFFEKSQGYFLYSGANFCWNKPRFM